MTRVAYEAPILGQGLLRRPRDQCEGLAMHRILLGLAIFVWALCPALPAAAQEATAANFNATLEGHVTHMQDTINAINDVWTAGPFCSNKEKQDAYSELLPLGRQADAAAADFAAFKSEVQRSMAYANVAKQYYEAGIHPEESATWAGALARKNEMLDLYKTRRDQLRRAKVKDCSQKQQQTGTQTQTEPMPDLPPAPPLPVDEQVPSPPDHFCSKEDSTKFLNDIVDPAMMRADAQGKAWSAYAEELERIAPTLSGANRDTVARLIAGARANEAKATATAGAWERARDRVIETPVIDCKPKTEEPRTQPLGMTPQDEERAARAMSMPPMSPELKDRAENFLYSWLGEFEEDAYFGVDKLRNCVTDPDLIDDLQDFIDDMHFRVRTGFVREGLFGEKLRKADYPPEIYQAAADGAQKILDSLPKTICPPILFKLSGGYLSIDPPAHPFAGSEEPSAAEPTLGLVKAKPRLDGYSFGASLNFPLCPSCAGWGSYTGDIGYTHSRADAKKDYPVIDPGLDNTLVLPGPEGGLSGFSLGSSGGLNVIDDATYRALYSGDGGHAGIADQYRLSPKSSLKLGVSLSYDHWNLRESFGGSIPGYARDFEYRDHAGVNSWGLSLTAAPKFDLSHIGDSRFYLAGHADLGLYQQSGSGTDELSFTGFSDSMEHLHASKTGFSYGAGASAGLEWATGLDVRFGVDYRRLPGMPVVDRNGTDPSALKLKGFGETTVYLRLSLSSQSF